MTSPPLLVRQMTAADCGHVGSIRVRGWQFAYRGLVPPSYLDALDPAEDADRLRARLARADAGASDLVAEPAGTGRIVGWAAHGPYRDGEQRTEDAELYALYVDPDHLGTGVGHTLLQESLRRRAALGHPRMFLWVLAGNERARRFYERAGFRADGAEEPFQVAGVRVPEVRYVRSLTVPAPADGSPRRLGRPSEGP
ncbi:MULTISPECIES: N-acetyltransferase family protein [unclassified Streptomyces]|uniref:GNAT family N-acetyltransferase n=1 Tax=unclassified Streptomyces TaxID=2593676 RepID=UPI003D70298A